MSSRNTPNDLLSRYTGPLPSMQGQDLLNRHNVMLPSIQPQDPIRRFIENHTNSYNAGRNTFTFSRDAARDGSGSVNPLDGNSQLRMERNHDRNCSSRATLGPDRVTLASGSVDDKAKWIRDSEGAGIAWEHRTRHNKNVCSHFETGVKNDNGAIRAFFRWAIGLN